MISFENVDKFILANMCVHIPKGVTVGLIGATGSGKTTFIKLICGLLAPDKGNVYVMDHEPVSMLGKREAELGVLFAQLPSLQTEETVVNNFHSLKLIYRLKESFFEKSYKTLSERLGFGGFQYEKIGNLSMGQRRRAELGAALIHNPRLLLLDEPTIGTARRQSGLL